MYSNNFEKRVTTYQTYQSTSEKTWTQMYTYAMQLKRTCLMKRQITNFVH
jgi:hypothetical protein